MGRKKHEKPKRVSKIEAKIAELTKDAKKATTAPEVQEDEEAPSSYDKLLSMLSSGGKSSNATALSEQIKQQQERYLLTGSIATGSLAGINDAYNRPEKLARLNSEAKGNAAPAQPRKRRKLGAFAPVLVDPYVTIDSDRSFKTFSRNDTFVDNQEVEPTARDPRYEQFLREVLAIDFSRKQNFDTWFQFFNKPRNEKQIEKLVNAYDKKNDSFVAITEQDNAKHNIDTRYFTLGSKIYSNLGGTHVPPIYDYLEDYFVERDLIPKWKTYLQQQVSSPTESDARLASASASTGETVGITSEEERSQQNNAKQSVGIDLDFRNHFQHSLFTILNDYRDFYFPYRNFENAKYVTEAYVLHTVNHLLKSKRYEWYNEEKREAREDYQVKDRGFARTKILFLVPFRSAAYDIVQLFLKLTPKLKNIRREDAFNLTFGDLDIDEDEDEEKKEKQPKEAPNNEDGQKKKRKKKKKSASEDFKAKPIWYQKIFDGNVDDSFCLGLALHNGQLEIMSPLQNSDIYIATPLGIVKELNDESTYEPGEFQSYLSSIELCIVDQCDVIMMQNWEHMIETFENLNQIPETSAPAFAWSSLAPSEQERKKKPKKESEEAADDEDEDGPETLNLAHVRDYFVHEAASDFRQTVLISNYMSPDINALFSNLEYCSNVRGKIKIRNSYNGIVNELKGLSTVPQVFERFGSNVNINLKDVDNLRYEYFVNELYPRFKLSPDGVFLVMVSSYLDFVRLRNFFNEERLPYYGVSEYTENASNVMAKFSKSGAIYLLYTERHFFFHAPKPSNFKVNQFVMYSLPENAFIYKSIVQRAQMVYANGDKSARVLSLFNVFDALKLERVVGTTKSQYLISAEESVHMLGN